MNLLNANFPLCRKTTVLKFQFLTFCYKMSQKATKCHKCLHEEIFLICCDLIISLIKINTQVFCCSIKVSLHQNLTQKVEMGPHCTIFGRILQGLWHFREMKEMTKKIHSLYKCQGKSILYRNVQENPFLYINVRELAGKFREICSLPSNTISVVICLFLG